eukprot:221006-Hanusia_phi.AAC.1
MRPAAPAACASMLRVKCDLVDWWTMYLCPAPAGDGGENEVVGWSGDGDVKLVKVGTSLPLLAQELDDVAVAPAVEVEAETSSHTGHLHLLPCPCPCPLCSSSPPPPNASLSPPGHECLPPRPHRPALVPPVSPPLSFLLQTLHVPDPADPSSSSPPLHLFAFA